MIRICTLLICCFLVWDSQAQRQSDFWLELNESQVDLPANLEPAATPEKHSLFWLDMAHIKQTLNNAPMEFENSGDQILFPIPMGDGSTEYFSVEYSPVMMPKLAAKYPMIRSFAAVSVENPENHARIVYSDRGLSVSVKTAEGIYQINPYSLKATDYHVGFYLKDIKTVKPFRCGVEEKHEFGHGKIPHLDEIDVENLPPGATLRTSAGDPVNLRVYRLANAATGAFTRRFGNTVSGALAAIVTAANRLNQSLEKEVAVRFMLIDDTDRVIFTTANDIYTTIEDGASLLAQNEQVLNDTFGFGGYDVGHVFTGGCINNLGGIAALASACGTNKGRGVTCFSSANIENIVGEIMTHEIGHQLAASHSWNNCPQFQDQRAGSFAFEPGSGSTIMSYSGACGNQNVQFGSDDYFHVGSLAQMYDFLENGGGSTCGTLEDFGNTSPDVNLSYTNGFSIPISTPFRLVAEGSDMDGDQVLYAWEQYDVGPIFDITIVNNNLTAPLFRSFPPTTDPERVFPRMIDVLNGTTSNSERLPVVSRDLTFRCTVRDWTQNGGGVDWEEVRFKASDAAGPFVVTQPGISDTWEVGEQREITWDVANTTSNPVNCQTVNIKMSTNSGNTFPITLAENVPNDGSHLIVVPNNPTIVGRILVEAADNIFFNVSRSFRVQAATQPGIFFNITPLSQNVCLPGNDPVVEVELAPLAGFDSLTTLGVSGLPAGAVANWSANPVRPSEGATLSIDMSAVTVSGNFAVEFTADAENLPTISRTVNFNLISDDFTALQPNSPANGATGVSKLPVFDWVDVPNADSYTLQIATSADFNAGSIVETIDNLNTNTFSLTNPLTENTAYYWRLLPDNDCNTTTTSTTFAFQTESVVCLDFTNDEDIDISPQGLPVVESTIEVPSGVLSDVSIPAVDIRHDRVRDMKGELVSPDGTRVVLFTEPLCGSRDLEVGFSDDAASSTLPCPPTGGASYQPEESLTAFDNKDGEGTWKLVITVTNTLGNGGFIDSWSLQTCGNLSLDPPMLVTNDTLGVPPGNGNPIRNNLLLAEDNNNSADELTFTVVNTPTSGELRFQGNAIGAGATFTQEDINNNRLAYKHLGNDAEFDSFDFTVSDGEGGWLFATFNIKIQDGLPTSVTNLDATEYLQVFPIPADQELNVRFLQTFSKDVQLGLYDIQGRQLQAHQIGQGQGRLQLSTRDLAAGMYFLQVVTDQGIISQKVTIAR